MSEATLRAWTGPNRTGKTQVNRIGAPARRVLTVSRIEDITPGYRRVHLKGEDLAEGFPYMNMAVQDHVKVLFPQPDTGELVIPTRTEQGWSVPEGSPPAISRDYTVRGWNAETGELTLDFVVHDHGVAGRWAKSAQPGDRLGVMGPRGNVVLPENYGWYLAVGDETVLPSIGRLFEELPAEAHIHAVIMVEDETEHQQLAQREGSAITWLHRRAGASLERAIRETTVPAGDDWYVFAAGEVNELVPVRDYFRKELELPRERVMISGYWKRGVSNLDHHNTGLED